jgi:hypothetical protein
LPYAWRDPLVLYPRATRPDLHREGLASLVLSGDACGVAVLASDERQLEQPIVILSGDLARDVGRRRITARVADDG